MYGLATSEYSTTSQCLSALLGRPGRVDFILDGLRWGGKTNAPITPIRLLPGNSSSLVWQRTLFYFGRCLFCFHPLNAAFVHVAFERKKEINKQKKAKGPSFITIKRCGPPKNGKVVLWLGTHSKEKQICGT